MAQDPPDPVLFQYLLPFSAVSLSLRTPLPALCLLSLSLLSLGLSRPFSSFPFSSLPRCPIRGQGQGTKYIEPHKPFLHELFMAGEAEKNIARTLPRCWKLYSCCTPRPSTCLSTEKSRPSSEAWSHAPKKGKQACLELEPRPLLKTYKNLSAIWTAIGLQQTTK